MSQHYDILGIGNAIMDVIASVDDQFLGDHDIAKGGMTLIDENRAIALTKAVASANPTEIAGGSGANTIVGAAMLGAKTAYLGLVYNDRMGNRFIDGLEDAGVSYNVPPADRGLATARCLIMVTADGERSMNTFLGASTDFSSAQLDSGAIKRSKLIYLEGYLFDTDKAKAAFVKAAEIAKAEGHKVALTLSDSFCVDRHRGSFKHLIEHHVDVLFANEAEIISLYETDFDNAIKTLATLDVIAAVTRSEKGSIIVNGRDQHVVDAVAIDKVVDTTGAGDQYAAGFLVGYSQGKDLATCGQWGSICAAEVISHFGARPASFVTLS
ncbi:adenosine kinase [Algimonas arctica]|uniref:Adenosine kinase n=1 Tax=Algimonas arctica TaxID=1479486 RepID=A0A8J3CQA1_9PROT|nr:adenosine kinase [Algimonas arctica]GHA85270.1 adenosine kinase [Algimonas arctica]